MRKIALVSSLLVAVGFGVISPTGQASAATDGNLSLGQFCTGSQASLVVNINGGQGQQFDVLLDGNVLINDLNGNSGTTAQIADGIYSISLVYEPDGVVQSATIGVSCGDPALAAFENCVNGFGALHVISVPGTAGSLDLYINGALAHSGIGDSTWGNDFEGYPDGTYVVGVKKSGQDNFLLQQEVEIDCVQGEQGQPAAITLYTWCDTPTIQVKLESFTFGELFTVSIDGTEKFTDVLFGWYNLDVAGTAHHLVITSSTDGVIYDDIVLLACSGPAVAARAECASEGTGDVFVKTLAGKGYVFSVSVDGQPVTDWQEVGHTGGEWQSLGEFSEGPHTVLIEWLSESSGEGSEQVLVDSDCTDDGSGTPLPDSGSNTTTLLLAAGLLVAAGLGLLGLRRRTA